MCTNYTGKKNIARRKMLEKETRANTERYQELRRKANRVRKKKKKENMKERLEEIKQLSKQNERRKFYKAKGRFQPRIIHCKTKTGKVICEESKVLDRREEHFKELLNKEVEDERMEWDQTDVESVRGRKKRKEEKRRRESKHRPTYKMGSGIPHPENKKIIKHLEKII